LRIQTIRRLFGVYLLFLLAITSRFAWTFAKDKDNWKIGDWLINYDGGFVRRGLPGEAILCLVGFGYGQAAWAVAVLQISLYVFVFAAVYLLLRDVRWSFPMLALLLSPATLAFQVLSSSGGLRKEIILFGAMSLLILLARNRAGPASENFLCSHPVFASLLVTVLAQVCVLSHESLVLYLPYLFAVVVIAMHNWRTSIYVCIVPTLLAFVSAFMAAKHHGSLQIAEAVCKSVGGTSLEASQGICSGAIAYLPRNVTYVASEVRRYFVRYDYPLLYGPRVILSLMPAAYLLVLLLRKTETRRHAKIVTAAFGVAFFCSLLLFYIAIDWGRWIYIHAMCLLLLLLFVDRRPSDQPVTWPPAEMSRFRAGLGYVLLAIYSTCWTLTSVGFNPQRFGYIDLYRYQLRSHFFRGSSGPVE
jgi:hypothetical protein